MLLPAALIGPICGRMIVPSGWIGVSIDSVGKVSDEMRITSPTLSRYGVLIGLPLRRKTKLTWSSQRK